MKVRFFYTNLNTLNKLRLLPTRLHIFIAQFNNLLDFIVCRFFVVMYFNKYTIFNKLITLPLYSFIDSMLFTCFLIGNNSRMPLTRRNLNNINSIQIFKQTILQKIFTKSAKHGGLSIVLFIGQNKSILKNKISCQIRFLRNNYWKFFDQLFDIFHGLHFSKLNVFVDNQQ